MNRRKTFFETADQLDRLIALDDPSQKDIEEAIDLISEQALERYFLRHLAESRNPNWFEPLRSQNLFGSSPEPIQNEGGVILPSWPCMWYLDAMAGIFPKQIIDIAEDLDTRNPFIMLDFVRLSCKMPPEHASKMVPLIPQWASRGMSVEGAVISLAIYLAQTGQWDAALDLVRLILSPQAPAFAGQPEAGLILPSAAFKGNSYQVEEFVEHSLDFFLVAHPLEVLHVAIYNLESAIQIESRDGSSDFSGWRPAIEPHEQNWSRDIRNLLVDVAAKALEYVVEREPQEAKQVIKEYLDHRYSIFRRLAIHTIRLNAEKWPDLLELLFTRETYLEDTNIYHEYWLLMQTAFTILPGPTQQNLLDRILAKLPNKTTMGTLEYHWERNWVLRRLLAIEGFIRSSQYQGLLDELVCEYGEPEYPSLLSYSRSSMGSASPISADSLSMMSAEDILAELRKELPAWPKGSDEPTQEGLADALQTAVKSNPGRFASFAPHLCDPEIAPFYTYHVLWGFREAWTQNRDFDWQPVLTLCKRVVTASDDLPKTNGPVDMIPGYWRTTYGSAKSAVAELLVAGVVRDDHTVPHSLLSMVRDVLLVLADDPNPSREYEAERIPERPHGVLDLALNVTRGKAVKALVQYSLHLARVENQELARVGIGFAPGSRLERSVREKLTEKLDKQKDPSSSVHSIFGELLPNLHYLDEKWLTDHLENIFPRQTDMSEYWAAAWDGYMFRSDFFGSLFQNLRPYYRYAIEQMALGDQGTTGSKFSQNRLARHLAALYWRGVEGLDEPGSLIHVFFESAPDEFRASFVGGIAAGLREASPGTDSVEWLRARNLWETRFAIIVSDKGENGQLGEHLKELAAYIDWVPHIPEAIDCYYGMIEASALVAGGGEAIRLLKYLASVAHNHAQFAVNLLEQLLRQAREPWFWATEDDSVRRILDAAMRSGNEDTRVLAVKAINWFGERGNERYRELLKLR